MSAENATLPAEIRPQNWIKALTTHAPSGQVPSGHSQRHGRKRSQDRQESHQESQQRWNTPLACDPRLQKP